jgi:serine O-acetyltransferase
VSPSISDISIRVLLFFFHQKMENYRRDNASQQLRAALWDETHYRSSSNDDNDSSLRSAQEESRSVDGLHCPPKPVAFYPDIDLSIPDAVYSDDGSVDLVWDLLRWEGYQSQESQREPLLVSFLHSTILNHNSLESSLAFLLANRLQSPAMMISTQLQSLILEALKDDKVFRRKLRADIMAVRDRDPACNTLPDCFLYFKGFHALQSHRVANWLWNNGKQVLAQYLQSQVSQIFQIDIHPNATLGSGIMLDHGTGIVIGETASVGHNCSVLHHVTLGGSGKKGVVRHPQVGSGVLLGAGATVLGPVTIGDGSQVGAGTLVISDLPAHCVAVGVPARIIGSFIDVTEQPSIGMNQLMDDRDSIVTFESEGI